MKTMTKKEFYEELERERKASIRTMAIGIVACIIAVVAVVLLATSIRGNEQGTMSVSANRTQSK